MLRESAIISVWVLGIALYLSRDTFLGNSNENSKEKMLTLDALSEFDGIKSPNLYLSIMGLIFDVTEGSKHYGKEGAYNFFVGKDATRNFVDGNFECKKNCDDITGLNGQELRSLDNWIKFYEKTYKYIGKLVGKYYEKNGQLTPYGEEVQKLLKKALEEETEEDRLKMKYPGCNLEWDLERGTHVWCTDQSGGIKRNWIGFPRKFFAPASKTYRCACIKEEDFGISSIKEYENCDSKSTHCFVKE